MHELCSECLLLKKKKKKKKTLGNAATGLDLIGSLCGMLRSACPLELSPEGYAEGGETTNRGAKEAT